MAKKAFISNTKIIVSNGMIEIWESPKDNPCFSVGLSKKPRGSSVNVVPMSEEERIRQNKKNALESYHHFERKVVANFKPGYSIFCTLTFDNIKTQDFNIKSVDECNKKFSRFIDRLKRYLKKKNGRELKFLVTIEFQDTNNRNAIHYHVLLDVPYLNSNELERIWNLGFVKVKKVKDSKHAAVYCGKYMMKGILDERLAGKNKFWGSKNLLEPVERYGDTAYLIQEYINGLSDDKKEKYSERSYTSEYNKCEIRYKKFFISDEALEELSPYLHYTQKTSTL